ncbi:hypothetical protein NDU88_002165 [Pleurodeles waltl]|uniref:Uncharacterized protein n=1 Tax=Pleurodeles waltl TaxID=8319 RepID=A0AAV7KY56_PLEWA|nr:hypothetical protein NDU88_002165 [Pleurodeles waltl]
MRVEPAALAGKRPIEGERPALGCCAQQEELAWRSDRGGVDGERRVPVETWGRPRHPIARNGADGHQMRTEGDVSGAAPILGTEGVLPRAGSGQRRHTVGVVLE